MCAVVLLFRSWGETGDEGSSDDGKVIFQE
jgi:hypothetical protein